MELVPADDTPLPPFAPGDHVEVEVGHGLRRSYSLTGPGASSPSSYQIAVALAPESRGGSKEVHALCAGQELSVSDPISAFTLDRSAHHTVLVAGGIGITALLPMVRTLVKDGASWELHYAARSRSSAAFLPELARISTTHPERIRLYLADEVGPRALDVRGVVTGLAQEGTHVYCYGPAPLLDDLLAVAVPLAPDRTHVERFTGDVGARGDRFEVELARAGVVLDIGPEDTVLDAVLDEGVPVDFSCMDGICGTCRTVVLTGTPDHRDSVLTESEREANDVMMICCSRARGGTSCPRPLRAPARARSWTRQRGYVLFSTGRARPCSGPRTTACSPQCCASTPVSTPSSPPCDSESST